MTTKLTTSYFQPPEPPQPSPAQQARFSRRRRFNRLYVYFPLGVVALLWLALILGLLWLTIAGEWFAMDTNREYFRSLSSGVADALTILMLIPLLLLCAIPNIAFIGFAIYRGNKKKAQSPQTKPLPLMWRLENKVFSLQEKVAHFTPRMARPVINGHAAAAFVRTLFVELKEIISQEMNRNVND